MSITGKSFIEGGKFSPSYGINHKDGFVDTECPYINKNFATWTLDLKTPVPEQLLEIMNEEFLATLGDELFGADTEEDFQAVIKKYIDTYEWPPEAFNGHQVKEDESTVLETIFSFCLPVSKKTVARRVHFDLHLLRPYFIGRSPKDPVHLTKNPMEDL